MTAGMSWQIQERELTEEEAQAEADIWAIRILTCVKHHCRQRRACLKGRKVKNLRECRMGENPPLPDALLDRCLDDLRHHCVRRLMVLNGEISAEDHAVWLKQRAEDDARREAIAFERAEKTLGLKPKKQNRNRERAGKG